MAAELNLTGQRYGRLRVRKFAAHRLIANKRPRKVRFWLCDCDCGGVAEVATLHLRSGRIKSCGCLKIEHLNRVRRQFPPEISFVRELYSQHKSNAKSRGLSHRLSFQNFEALIFSACTYCGMVGSNWRKSRGAVKTNGIDRVDNEIGYTVKNSVPCCRYCNSSKHTKRLVEWKR